MGSIASSVANASAQFYDCKSKLETVKDSLKAFDMIKQAKSNKNKFSSECLELLLMRNYMKAARFLIDEYYPQTSIDSEIIVKRVASEI